MPLKLFAGSLWMAVAGLALATVVGPPAPEPEQIPKVELECFPTNCEGDDISNCSIGCTWCDEGTCAR